MVFSSLIFLFVFLPMVLLGNSLLPRRRQNILLFIASLLFYAWGETVYVAIMLVSICLNYGFGRLVGHCRRNGSGRWALGGGVAANLLLLGYYKYANFLVDAFTPVLQAVHLPPVDLAPLAYLSVQLVS